MQNTTRNVLYPFLGSEKAFKIYSQSYQDVFILSLLNGKENGTYLEIGAGWPDFINNTNLLSKHFSWKGLSIEILQDMKLLWDEKRPNDNLLIGDAMEIDYSAILPQYFQSNIIDYLQVDIEPSNHTLAALKKIPLNDYRFKIITFETDLYAGGPGQEVRRESRQILQNLGYELIVGDVRECGVNPYEDWWVDLNYVNKDIALDIKNRALQTQHPLELLFY